MWSFVGWGLLLIVIAEIIDGFAHPRGLRTMRGIVLRLLPVALVMAGLVALLGSFWLSAIIAMLLLLSTVVGSNIKYEILGEPLVFSDLIVFISFLRAPKFYLHAIPVALRVALPIVFMGLLLVMVRIARSGDSDSRLDGVLVAFVLGVLSFMVARRATIMKSPDLGPDVRRFGLLSTLVMYSVRWRRERPPLPISPLKAVDAPPLLIVIQCESFADPRQLFNDTMEMPGLALARHKAILHGNLLPSGFGAYTMRTEYGVMCGRDDSALGFRRYDPFLTSDQETSFALPNRLAASYPDRVFIHPHDMRFYARHRIVPNWGFNQIVGDDRFAPDAAVGPYIGDIPFGASIAGLAHDATKPTLIYGVSMENHGPWKSNRMGMASAADAYRAHLANSDRMLHNLITDLGNMRADALLVFYGDHRPSIPNVVHHKSGRATPYVMLRFVDGRCQATSPRQADLTPAMLHQEILAQLSNQSPQAANSPS